MSRIRSRAALRGAALLLALALPALAGAEPRLASVSGEVEIGRGEPPRWAPAREGDVLGVGDVLRTGGDGRAEVALGSARVRLYEHSLLRLPADAMRATGGPAAVELERGSSLFDVDSRRPADPFEVRTPEVVASVKGTRFGVLTGDAGAAVNVYEGLVGVRPGALEDGREVLVRAGFGAVNGSGGSFELLLLPAGDPWQGWRDGAPPPLRPASIDRRAELPASIAEARAAARRETALEQLAARPALRRELAERRGDDPDEERERAAVDEIDGERRGLPRRLRVRLAESLLNGTAPSTTAAASPPSTAPTSPLSVQVVNQGTPELVISSATGPLAQLSVGDLQTALQTGDVTALGTPVLDTLTANGVDPVVFTQQLRALLR